MGMKMQERRHTLAARLGNSATWQRSDTFVHSASKGAADGVTDGWMGVGICREAW